LLERHVFIKGSGDLGSFGYRRVIKFLISFESIHEKTHSN
jgi:hypothetical protein